jgi:hypothetical protein
VFLVFGAALESLLGEDLFETYHLDIFLGALIVAGLVHSGFYFLAFGVMSRVSVAHRVYRVGRNLTYAVIPPFVAAVIAMIWQDMHQRPLLEGELVEVVFFWTWGLFAVLGLVESMVVSRCPLGLGSQLKQKFDHQ